MDPFALFFFLHRVLRLESNKADLNELSMNLISLELCGETLLSRSCRLFPVFISLAPLYELIICEMPAC